MNSFDIIMNSFDIICIGSYDNNMIPLKRT